ncbi:MAG: hypothetical protein EAY65_04285 [Alphaproteobacteria bacterium]|nr:MAG: hypothetical protein EAY65_04285 [Alphaproteobacteria bacterium]
MSGQNSPQGDNVWTSWLSALLGGVLFKKNEEAADAYESCVVYPDGFSTWAKEQQFAWLIELGNEDELWKHAQSIFPWTPENMPRVVGWIMFSWRNIVCDDKESKENQAVYFAFASLLTCGYLRQMADKEKGSYHSLKKLVGAMLYRHDECFTLLKPWRKQIEARCKASWATDRYKALIADSDIDFWNRRLGPVE